LFSATAQEFLASIIFVFVKHPFDVGDRVDVYSAGGADTVETYFVKEIALMYTEFKKLDGAVVQAPNSLLNSLFILNMRRSGPVAEAIPIICKFGTSLDQIDALRERMQQFVKSEKREYQSKVITELRDIPNMNAVKINVIFFYKSNWQIELVRLQRRNKFMCALMCNVSELGIESPNMRWPGQKLSAPVYLQSVHAELSSQAVGGVSGYAGGGSTYRDVPPELYKSFDLSESILPPGQDSTTSRPEHPPSRLDNSSIRGKRVEFSLGVKDIVSMDNSGDVFDDGPRLGRMPSSHLQKEDVIARSTGRASRETIRSHGILSRRRTDSVEGSGTWALPKRTISVRNRFFGRRSQDEGTVLPTHNPHLNLQTANTTTPNITTDITNTAEMMVHKPSTSDSPAPASVLPPNSTS
jgi:hypothetical protein